VADNRGHGLISTGEKEKLVPDMIIGLVVVVTTWKSSGISVQLNANFLLLLNIKNTNRTECNIILSLTVLLLSTFSIKTNHFGIFCCSPDICYQRPSIAGSGTCPIG
jgi:hypothetical protein